MKSSTVFFMGALMLPLTLLFAPFMVWLLPETGAKILITLWVSTGLILFMAPGAFYSRY